MNSALVAGIRYHMMKRECEVVQTLAEYGFQLNQQMGVSLSRMEQLLHRAGLDTNGPPSRFSG